VGVGFLPGLMPRDLVIAAVSAMSAEFLPRYNVGNKHLRQYVFADSLASGLWHLFTLAQKIPLIP
jgi:hypothetical protein